MRYWKGSLLRSGNSNGYGSYATLTCAWLHCKLQICPLVRRRKKKIIKQRKLKSGNGPQTGQENREYVCRDPSLWPRYILYPQKLAVTSPTIGGRSVGIVLTIYFTLLVFCLIANIKDVYLKIYREDTGHMFMSCRKNAGKPHNTEG
jgi:hypothetical protein